MLVSHAKPVLSWGFEPCGGHRLPTSIRVSAAGVGAPRPPGTGRGDPEVQTLLTSAPSDNGHRYFVGGRNGANNESVPTPEAAPSLQTVLSQSFQGSDFNRADGIHRLEDISAERLDGDLGKAAP